ncbi:MAG: thiamine diphosphokinase [Firmicutes bacterium]|nr:thiamine diphosphokinase [Bacillota bacterium]
MGRHCALVAGGLYSPLDGIKNADFIIACDKGLEYCLREGVQPDLLVGDFDSYEGEIPQEIACLQLPCEKDDTDTLAALRYALQQGYDQVTLYCALGGRMDHLMANIQTGAFAAEQGAFLRIADRQNPLCFFGKGSHVFPRKEGFYIAVFSLLDRALGVCIRGAKYSVENVVLTNRFPIGVSNEWAGDAVTVSVEEGILMVVESAAHSPLQQTGCAIL